MEEVEAKFVLPDEEALQRLQAAETLTGYALSESRVEQVQDTYLDTADGALLVAGYALRQREGEDGVLVTLKGLGGACGGIHRRVELEARLASAAPPAGWPTGPLRAEVLALAGEAPLVPFLTLCQERHVRRVEQGERAVALMSLDRVRGTAGKEVFEVREAEIELLPAGSEGDLAALAAALRDEWGLAPQPRSKFERALLAFGKRLLKGPGLEADDSMAEAARKTLRFHYRLMLFNEPETRRGEEPEALHDMRVAVRRMRTALQVFGDYLDQRQLKPLTRALRRTGRALGAVRDLDVFWEHVQSYLETLPPAQQARLEPLYAAWRARREAARQEMLAYLDSEEYARFKERWWAFLRTPGAAALPVVMDDGQARPHRLHHVVPVVVHERLAEVQAYDEWVSQADAPPERLHRLRIAAKRLRYTLEYFHEILAPHTGELIETVKELQDHLGAIQDAVVARQLLRDFLGGGQASWPPDAADGVADYVAARQKEFESLRASFPQLWARFRHPSFARLVRAAWEPLEEGVC